MRHSWWVGGLLLGLVLGLGAGPATRPGVVSPQERVRLIQENVARTAELFRQGKYAEADEAVREGMRLAPRESSFPYNLACALARQGRAQEAIAALESAVKLGYAQAEEMRQDEDLASVREDPAFGRLVRQAEANRQKLLGEYQRGEAIPNVESIEGNPADGLRWRLRLGRAAAKARPHRLVIWLHPSGGSMNREVERLSPELAGHGFALLVFTQKDYAGWSPDDAKRLDVSLGEVAKVERVDARHPILLGFSAGGQMALALHDQDPGRFGGLILDAAYPVVPGPNGPVVTGPPDDPAARKVPIYVIVGQQDGGSRIWQSVHRAWQEAGIPLTIRYIPNGRHQWLFGPVQLRELYQWLDQVRAGQLPATAAPATRPG